MKKARQIITLILCLCMMLPLSIETVAVIAEENTEQNVALGKFIESTSGTGAELALDGNLSTYWDSTVGRTTPESSVTVDLVNWYRLSEITVINYFDGARYYHYTVEVSTDGIDFVLIGDKNDNSIATSEGNTFEGPSESVRYIRVTMTANSANPEYHICELQAWGVQDTAYVEEIPTEDKDDPDNIAFGKPTRANYNDVLSGRVTDARINSSWTGNAFPQYVDVDLMDNYDISEIIVYMPEKDNYTYTVYGSLDGVRFERIAESNERKKGSAEGERFVFETALNYRVIRVNVTSASAGGKASVNEIKIHGVKNGTSVIPTREKLEFTSYDEWLLENHGVDTSLLKDANGNYDVEDTYTEEDTVNALKGLVSRVLGDGYNEWFEFSVEPNKKSDNDYFSLSGGGNEKVKITGNDGVAIACGLNHYLKYYCYVNVSQQTKQVSMPDSAPAVEGTVRKETESEVRYAYNYCTLSYTMQFYGFDEWQRELDYLMLQGVNVILDTTASEALWVMYLQQYGYTAQEAIDFVCGYAYKAWWLMGNLENYGGNVGDQWIYDTLEMARVNQRYMTVMGCMPCLSIFAGTLPANFESQANEVLAEMGYPNVGDYMTSTGYWAGFERPHSMNSTFQGFKKMTEDFYGTQNHLYGQITDYYAGDFLHEIDSGFQLDPAFNKARLSRTVLDLLLEENGEACWIMQSWWENPLPEVVAGFGEDREEHVLMLDLAAANGPRWTNTANYGGLEFGGSGWVFCMLDNYGGRSGMHGAFSHVMNNLLDAYEGASHFKGIGITPEGTEENPASYDFYWELIWVSLEDIPEGQTRDEFVKAYVENWISEYAKRRYGSDSENIQEAWKLLGDSVYGRKTSDGTGTNGIITQYPRILGSDNISIYYSGTYYNPPYYRTKLENALELMMLEFDALKDKETYIYDLCDIMSQLLTNSSAYYFNKMAIAVQNKDFNEFRVYKNKYLRCIELIDEVTAYVDDTMLGNWVGRVDDWIDDERTGDYADYDVDMMKYNTLTLITTWASHESLIGYANRQYSGLLDAYYGRMWTDYLNLSEEKFSTGAFVSLETDRELNFQYAWDMIISRGEGLEREVNPATGDTEKGIRSLEAIYTEISDRYLEGSEPFLNSLVVTDDASGYELKNKKLIGVTEGTTAKALAAKLAGDKEGNIKILSPEGYLLSEDEELYAGCKAVLYDKYGAETDFATVSTLKSTPETEDSTPVEAPSAAKPSIPTLPIVVGSAVVVIIAIIAAILVGKKPKAK